MFWRFGGYSNISTIDTILDKPNVKLEDLLDESDLIQELKSHHTKLIEYLRDDRNLRALLHYVIAPGADADAADDADKGEQGEEGEKECKGKEPDVETDDDDDEEDKTPTEEEEKAEKKRLKYAFVACEILSCETWSITESLMTNTPDLTEFWDFLRRPAPLDPLQAGYFTKVNETLLEKKTEDMLDFFKSLPGIVPAMLQHVDCPMVMDLLLKIISMEKSDGGMGIVDWLHAQDLVPMLLASLAPECNSSTQTSAGDFLKAIITISANAAQNEQSCIGPNSLTRQLVSEPCIETLIEFMLQGGNPLTVGVGIVIEVIRKNNSDYDPDHGHSPDAPPTNHDPIYLGTLLRLFARHVPDFMSLVLSAQHTVTIGEATSIVDRGHLKSAWGTQIEPLGFDRFKTCELMAELLHCSNMGLLNEPGSEEFIKRRDAERERLRQAGAFLANNKSVEESAIDISAASSRFENSFSQSAEELRIANTVDEDGFEEVAKPDVPENSGPLGSNGDLVDEPLSPRESRVPESDRAAPSATTQNLDETVRRLSLDTPEDTDMTSPPNEPEGALNSPGNRPGEKSPTPEDGSVPQSVKTTDPNKTPTPSSPETVTSSPRAAQKENAETTTREEDQHSFQAAQDDTMVTTQPDSPVVGDYLKIMFVENRVVPTILSFFFRFPWNNFLHNVVYDVVQQVFNGPMDRGHNRILAFDLFETGRITEQIIEGQRRSDEAQQEKNMRLGYMGHLTLVAEEVVKFGERHPRELLSPTVQDYIYCRPWEEYVTKVLAETRERDNAILGGFRPDNGLGPRQAVLNAVQSGQTSFSGSGLAAAGLNQPLDSIDLSNNGSATSAGYNSGGSLSSGFGSSSDDEDEEMDDADDDDRPRTANQLSTADSNGSSSGNAASKFSMVNFMLQSDSDAQSDQPVPLLPPPPAPLNIEPSRARRRLADRLARHKQEQEEQEMAASEFGNEADDPFAALGDADTNDNGDPFALDEEEQDITTFGKRSNRGDSQSTGDHHAFSASRGLTSLFSNQNERDLDGRSDDSDSGSDIDTDAQPLEARTSLERKPLDIDDDDDDDDDDDEEMGEMVAPSEEPEENSSNSSDEEVLSPTEKEKFGFPMGDNSGSRPADDGEASEFSGQDDDEGDDQLVEIAMPSSSKRRSRG